MGNVFAASKPPTYYGSSIGTVSPPPAQDKKTKVDIQNLGEDIQHSGKVSQNPGKDIHNPGKLAELHRSTEEVFPSTFDGARIICYNRLSSYFHVHHSFTLCKQSTSYRYGANYDVAAKPGSTKVRPMLSGELDTSGTLSANMFHRIGNRLELEFHTVMANRQFCLSHLRADVRGDRCTSSFALLNPDPFGNFQGTFVAQYLQKLTKQLDLGVELACKRTNRRIPGERLAVASFSGRYTGPDYVASGSVGPTRLHLCFYQKASDQLHLGVELESFLTLDQSLARIGYHVSVAELDMQCRGSFDTNMNVAAVFEKKLNPTPFTMAISGSLNHKKHVFRLGLGFITDV